MMMMILQRPSLTSEHTTRVLALLAGLLTTEELLAAVVVGVEEGLEVGAVQIGPTEHDALGHLIDRQIQSEWVVYYESMLCYV